MPLIREEKISNQRARGREKERVINNYKCSIVDIDLAPRVTLTRLQ
jgi:hypothetical protein